MRIGAQAAQRCASSQLLAITQALNITLQDVGGKKNASVCEQEKEKVGIFLK